MRGPSRYQALAQDDRGSVSRQSDPTSSETRREDLKGMESAPTAEASRVSAPAPAPKPRGELLNELDPWQAARANLIEDLNELARTGKIDWAEWGRQVRQLGQEFPGGTRQDELAEARATAARARAHEEAEAARDRENEERER